MFWTPDSVSWWLRIFQLWLPKNLGDYLYPWFVYNGIGLHECTFVLVRMFMSSVQYALYVCQNIVNRNVNKNLLCCQIWTNSASTLAWRCSLLELSPVLFILSSGSEGNDMKSYHVNFAYFYILLCNILACELCIAGDCLWMKKYYFKGQIFFIRSQLFNSVTVTMTNI